MRQGKSDDLSAAGELRQRFLLRLHDRLRLLTNAGEILYEAARTLGEHLGASRVGYAEDLGDGETVTVTRNYTRGVPGIEGIYRYSDYGPALIRDMRQGRTVIYSDIAHDPALSSAEKEAHAVLQLGATVNVPLVKGGRLVAILFVHQIEPRIWTSDEVALMEETAQRTWADVERAHSQEALRASEEQYRTLFDSIDEGFCTIEVLFDEQGKAVDYRFLEANPAFVRQTGLKDAIGRTIRELVPEHEEFWFETYGHIARTGEAMRFEHAATALDRFYDVYAFRIGQPEQNRVAVLFNDILARKRAEEALRTSESGFRTISEAAPALVWVCSAQGENIYFNERWHEYTGQTKEEAAGYGWTTTMHPEDAARILPYWQHCQRTGEPYEGEVRYRRHDGDHRWHTFRGLPRRNEAGEIEAWYGLSIDTDDAKRAEEALRTSEERFRLLVEGAKDYAMFLLDTEGKITFWSAGAERVFGWTEKEVLGWECAFIFTPEDRAAGVPEQEIQTALMTGRALDRRWHLRYDGSRFWADGVLMRLDDEAGNLRGFAKIARDATAQRLGEEIKEEALQAVARANEALDQRVEKRTRELSEMSSMRQELLRKLIDVQEEERGRISRDLHDDTGQQMAALLLTLGNLQSLPALSQDPAAQWYLEQASTLVADIARKSHRLSSMLRPIGLDDLSLIGALENYGQTWKGWSGIAIQVGSTGFKGSERLPAELEITIYRVVQEALTNILKHATKRADTASASASKKRSVKKKSGPASNVSVLVQRRDGEVLTVIEDNGPGFDVEAALSRPPGQRRLGLFGMQERARLVGGELWIESGPGTGTCVYLKLPVSDTPERQTLP